MTPQLPPVINKIGRVEAGYLYIQGTDYRCSDCWCFIPGKAGSDGLCQQFSKDDIVSPHGYCNMFAYGNPVANAIPRKAYTPDEVGYGEDSRGTKCVRCRHFMSTGSSGAGVCEVVEGSVKTGACCNSQEPPEERNHTKPRQVSMELPEFNALVA